MLNQNKKSRSRFKLFNDSVFQNYHTYSPCNIKLNTWLPSKWELENASDIILSFQTWNVFNALGGSTVWRVDLQCQSQLYIVIVIWVKAWVLNELTSTGWMWNRNAHHCNNQDKREKIFVLLLYDSGHFALGDERDERRWKNRMNKYFLWCWKKLIFLCYGPLYFS